MPVQASPYFVSTPTNIITTPATCTMANGQITSATFIVLSSCDVGYVYCFAYWVHMVTLPTATFVVQSTSPTVSLNPNSGPAGTVVAVSGSGFAASDTSCNIQSSPGTSIIGP